MTVGVLLVAGCISEPAPEETGGISTASFIDVVVALREAEREAVRTDSAPAVFARRKEEILSEHGVTPDQLRAYVERHRNDFVLMDAVWDSIARRLRYVPEDASSGRELHVEQIR